jgi:hypothetical protein
LANVFLVREAVGLVDADILLIIFLALLIVLGTDFGN